MLVRDRMTLNPVTITPDVSVTDALRLMSEKKIRRLPVIDGQGNLVGIVSDRDLLLASPSPATSLAIWEIHELLAKLTVEKMMTREVITVSEDTPLEEAARVMADGRIGGLPVLTVPVPLSGGLTTGLQVVVDRPGSPAVRWALDQFGR